MVEAYRERCDSSWRATIALLIIVVLAGAPAAVLYVTKGWLVATGERSGIEAYNIRLNSTLAIQDVVFDLP